MTQYSEGAGDRLALDALDPAVAKTAGPFFQSAIAEARGRLLSIAVVGSAATADYRPGVSDVNSCFVLDRVDVAFLDALAGLGKSFGRQGLAVPLLMTPEYIERSLDVFPLEFLEFKAAHTIVYGRDFFAPLSFDKADVRLAAERELKSLAVNLRRKYLSCLGDPKRLQALLVSSLNSVLPVLRGLLFLKDAPPPLTKSEIVDAAARFLGLPLEPFKDILAMRDAAARRSFQDLQLTFKGFYDALEKESLDVDRL